MQENAVVSSLVQILSGFAVQEVDTEQKRVISPILLRKALHTTYGQRFAIGTVPSLLYATGSSLYSLISISDVISKPISAFWESMQYISLLDVQGSGIKSINSVSRMSVIESILCRGNERCCWSSICHLWRAWEGAVWSRADFPNVWMACPPVCVLPCLQSLQSWNTLQSMVLLRLSNRPPPRSCQASSKCWIGLSLVWNWYAARENLWHRPW